MLPDRIEHLTAVRLARGRTTKIAASHVMPGRSGAVCIFVILIIGPDRRFPSAYIRRLKQLADQQGLPWTYAPLHQHLHHACESGSFQIEHADICP